MSNAQIDLLGCLLGAIVVVLGAVVTLAAAERRRRAHWLARLRRTIPPGQGRPGDCPCCACRRRVNGNPAGGAAVGCLLGAQWSTGPADPAQRWREAAEKLDLDTEDEE